MKHGSLNLNSCISNRVFDSRTLTHFTHVQSWNKYFLRNILRINPNPLLLIYYRANFEADSISCNNVVLLRFWLLFCQHLFHKKILTKHAKLFSATNDLTIFFRQILICIAARKNNFTIYLNDF